MTRWFVYEWGKPTQQKSHQVILRSPLPKLHYYHSKWLQVKKSQYLIPTYSWTLTPIPNWTCSVVTISPFNAWLPSTWLTNCADPSTRPQSPTREGCWLQSSSVHQYDEDHETHWLQNSTAAASSRERWTRAYVSSHNMLVKNFFIKLQQLWRPLK